jgi:hypothetical protein
VDEHTRRKLYADEKGPLTLEAYERESERRFPCCWEPRADGHNRACPNYEEPVVEAQAALI